MDSVPLVELNQRWWWWCWWWNRIEWRDAARSVVIFVLAKWRIQPLQRWWRVILGANIIYVCIFTATTTTTIIVRISIIRTFPNLLRNDCRRVRYRTGIQSSSKRFSSVFLMNEMRFPYLPHLFATKDLATCHTHRIPVFEHSCSQNT